MFGSRRACNKKLVPIRLEIENFARLSRNDEKNCRARRTAPITPGTTPSRLIRARGVPLGSICQGRAASNLSSAVSCVSSHLSFCSGPLSAINYLSNRAKLRLASHPGHPREMKGSLIAFNRYTGGARVRTYTCPLCAARDVALRQIN